jgi:very-short-patch-repair endonuclease
MRARPTPSESRLWSCLRARTTGVEFRRQVVIAGKFIVDFLAPAVGLIVEIDGPYHSRRVRADESRDRKLRRLGYGVLRLEAVLVEQHLEKAVALIRAALAEPP